jgi:hypothetical protein
MSEGVAIALIGIAALVSVSCTRTPDGAGSGKQDHQTNRQFAYPNEFWAHWQPDKAEVSVYDVVLPRKHQYRKATATAVFNIDRFSRSRRVATSRQLGPDVWPAMKMHVLRKYTARAGDSLTAFAILDEVDGQPAGAASRIDYANWSLSGTIWRQLLPNGRQATLAWHVATEEEADGLGTRTFGDQNNVPEDCLPIAARRIGWPILRLGETGLYNVISSIEHAGVHNDRGATAVHLSLTSQRRTTVVPAGSFRTHTFKAVWPRNVRNKTWDVEADPPHRIVRWTSSEGESANLVSSTHVSLSTLTASDSGPAMPAAGVQPPPWAH